MSLRSRIVAQFRQPHGLLGHVAGTIMAVRGSNRMRNLWTVDLLELQPDHRVLEIGCGPGVSLEACAAKIKDGRILGIDHSDVMIRQASKRLPQEVESGKVMLVHGDLDQIKRFDDEFDRIFSVNVVQFLPDMKDAFGQIYHQLKNGGIAATTYQPRQKNPTREDALNMADRISGVMKDIGFANIRIEELSLKPVPAICVLGQRTDEVSP